MGNAVLVSGGLAIAPLRHMERVFASRPPSPPTPGAIGGRIAVQAAWLYRVYSSKSAYSPEVATWAQIDLGTSQTIDKVTFYPSNRLFSVGDGFPVRFRIECSDDEELSTRQMIADRSKSDCPDPNDHVTQFGGANVRGRFVRLTVIRQRRNKALAFTPDVPAAPDVVVGPIMSTRLQRSCVSILTAAFSSMAIAMSCVVSAADMHPEYAGSIGPEPPPHLKVARFVGESTVELLEDKKTFTIVRGERHGAWTFMGITFGQYNYAIFEDFQNQDGHVLFIDTGGVQIDLPKTAESNIQNLGKLYLGHSREEIVASATDLLGNELLSKPGDPEYSSVEDILPKSGVLPNGYDQANSTLLEGFVGTPDTSDKIYFMSGGRTANFDPASFQPSIVKARQEGTFKQGLLGGDLPAVRFVYPEGHGVWTEMIAFAPFRIVNGNDRVQPVWYRVSRVENGTLKWSRYIDSYQSFPMRKDKTYTVENGQAFYVDLIKFRERWSDILNAGMRISLPDKQVENMAHFSLVGSIMTRAGDFPKYGVTEGGYSGYGGSEHDGFPDTFTAETDAMLEWGLLSRASHYIDNYLEKFVRDNGAILYRGPETGQYGRILTILAQYLNEGGDVQVILRNRGKIESIAHLLLALRTDAIKLSKDDPAYGMLSGWSEADSSLKLDPSRYTQPYLSNSTETVRGFRDFGRAWQSLGRKTGNSDMALLGERLTREAFELKRDVDLSISKSILTTDGQQILPPIAGVTIAPDVAIARDEDDPQWEYYRVFMEMSRSGVLSAEQVELMRNYLLNHHGLILGMPSTFDDKGKYTSFGFLSSGYAYALIQTDHIREALLMLYSNMAHQYTRGTWIAPEERDPLAPGWMSYSTAAQATIAPIVRWLLVFEDPESDTLWLGKGIPTQWLNDGQTIAVNNAPTQWGKVSFQITSHAHAGRIEARLTFPDAGLRAETKLRLRAGAGFQIRSVTLNGKPWSNFNPTREVIVLPSGISGTVSIVARD